MRVFIGVSRSIPQEILNNPFKAILTKFIPSQGNYCQNVKEWSLVMYQ